jgi:hypothetical protein
MEPLTNQRHKADNLARLILGAYNSLIEEYDVSKHEYSLFKIHFTNRRDDNVYLILGVILDDRNDTDKFFVHIQLPNVQIHKRFQTLNQPSLIESYVEALVEMKHIWKQSQSLIRLDINRYNLQDTKAICDNNLLTNDIRLVLSSGKMKKAYHCCIDFIFSL